MFDNSDRTEIAAMGEFGLIQHLSQHFENKHAKTVKGIGDDCAVIDQGDHFSLVTTDVLLEGVHFDLSFHPLKHLGYKAISVAVSDIYAMNGMAEQVMVGLGLSNRFSLEAWKNCMPVCKSHANIMAWIWWVEIQPLHAVAWCYH